MSDSRRPLDHRGFTDALDKIYRWFIGPISRAKPDSMEMKDWQEQFMHLADRQIVKYRSIKPTVVPGNVFPISQISRKANDFRKISEGTLIFVRYDRTIQDQFDVEVIDPIKEPSYTYRMNRNQWQDFKKYLKLVVSMFFVAITMQACGARGYHVVRPNRYEVVDEKTKIVCVNTYSDYGTEGWSSYYASPCSVFIRGISK